MFVFLVRICGNEMETLKVGMKVKYDGTEFAVELKIWRGEKYSCCMAGNSSAGRAVVQGLGGEAAPVWPKPYTLNSRNCCCLETSLSSILFGVTAVLGAGIC